MRSGKQDKSMLLSHIEKEGKAILKDIYFVVLKSKEKTLWQNAIDSMHNHIAMLEVKAKESSGKDQEDATDHIRNLWAWQAARREMCRQFGNKFIRPFLPSPPSYEQ